MRLLLQQLSAACARRAGRPHGPFAAGQRGRTKELRLSLQVVPPSQAGSRNSSTAAASPNESLERRTAVNGNWSSRASCGLKWQRADNRLLLRERGPCARMDGAPFRSQFGDRRNFALSIRQLRNATALRSWTNKAIARRPGDFRNFVKRTFLPNVHGRLITWKILLLTVLGREIFEQFTMPLICAFAISHQRSKRFTATACQCRRTVATSTATVRHCNGDR